MKLKFLTLFVLLNFSLVFSQNDKTVTLTVSAQGQTLSEAKQNALRDAIEQAFGTFISSNTEILNDELVKDEIVSVSNGNIQNYKVISEVELPNGGYATTLKATVSVTKLTSFVESKGVGVEFKGSLFGANLRQQKLNEDAEHKSIVNLCKVSDEILSKSLDYNLSVGEPILSKNIENSYELELIVEMNTNENYNLFEKYFLSVIRSLGMTESEIENYKKLNKLFYKVILTSSPNATITLRTDRYGATKEGFETFYFRNIKTAVAIQNLFIKSNKYLHNYFIKSNQDTITVKLGDIQNKSNIYNYDSNINLWNLNIRKLERNLSNQHLEEKSNNKNPGFPYFNFEKTSFHLVSSSWDIYFNYIDVLKDKSVFFDKNFYFEADGEFYEKNGKPRSYGFSNYPYRDSSIPYSTKHIKYFYSTAEDQPLIGKFLILGSNKVRYYSRYIAIYSESEIAKITNFTVKPNY